MGELETRLQQRLARQKSTARAKQKKHYELAKELGFSPTEAVVLQNWKESAIRQLAEERGNNGQGQDAKQENLHIS